MAFYKLKLTIYDKVKAASNVRLLALCLNLQRPMCSLCVSVLVVQGKHGTVDLDLVKFWYKDKIEK